MKSDRIIRTTFIISLISHGLFLGAPSFNINSPRTERPKELTLQIEIEKPSLLPKIERMGKEKKFKLVNQSPSLPVTQLKTGKPANQPTIQPSNYPTIKPSNRPVKERVEILNPADEAILRYQDMVKQRIEEVRRYPEWAKEQGIEGVAHLRFIVLANGNGREIKLVHSSGFKILDQEAIVTINRASPFPPFPKEIANSSIQMEVSLVFTLK